MPPSKKAVVSTNTKSIAELTRAMIFKTTHQKPLKISTCTHPHVPSGSSIIDYIIGGSPARDGKGLVCPGYPRRRITEIYGPESSGKTTAALTAIAAVQKQGGVAMFLDFEHALHHGYAQALGVSFQEDKLLLYAPDTMEEGFKMILVAICSGIDLIVVDSVSAMVPKDELDKSIDDSAKIGAQAALFSRQLPKMVLWLSKYPTDKEGKKREDAPGSALIFLNQIRAKISTSGYSGGGDTENTSGGQALKFFAYLRLRLSKNRADFIKKKDPMSGKERNVPFGNLTDVKVVKSKVDAKQGHVAQVFIRYGLGIDDIHSLIEAGVVNRIIKKEGPYFTLGSERFQGKERLRKYLLDSAKTTEDLKTKVLAAVMSTAFVPVEEDDEDMSDENLILSQVASNLPDDMDEEEVSSLLAAPEILEESSAEDASAPKPAT